MPERVEIAEAEPLRLECEHFMDCITNGKIPVTDGIEGLRVLRVLNSAQMSLDDGGRRISACRSNERSKKPDGQQ